MRTDRQDPISHVEQRHDDEADAVIVAHVRPRDLRRSACRVRSTTDQAERDDVMRGHLDMIGAPLLEVEHDELVQPVADLAEVDEALAGADAVRVAGKDGRSTEARVADIAENAGVDGECDGEARGWAGQSSQGL